MIVKKNGRYYERHKTSLGHIYWMAVEESEYFQIKIYHALVWLLSPIVVIFLYAKILGMI